MFEMWKRIFRYSQNYIMRTKPYSVGSLLYIKIKAPAYCPLGDNTQAGTSFLKVVPLIE